MASNFGGYFVRRSWLQIAITYYTHYNGLQSVYFLIFIYQWIPGTNPNFTQHANTLIAFLSDGDFHEKQKPINVVDYETFYHE